jgi:hypothetical protein
LEAEKKATAGPSLPLPPPPPSHPPPELTGHEKRWNELFEKLVKASPDEMLTLGRAYIEAEPEFDEEDAFALAIEFVEAALEKVGREAELLPFIELIRQRHPAAYEANVGYFAERTIDAAYESGEDPAPRLLDWAKDPTRQFEYFERALEQALFHGREDLALKALETGKQALLDDDDLFPWSKGELARLVLESALAAARVQPVPTASVALCEEFGVFTPEYLAERLALSRRAASMRVDELKPDAEPEAMAWQLYLLAAGFAQWLVGAHGWQPGRAALAHLGLDHLLRQRVAAYVAERDEDEEDEGEGKDDTPPPRRWQGKPPRISSLLGLDDKKLGKQLSDNMNMVGGGAYLATAVLLALPHWRPFLLEAGGDPGTLSDPAKWLESSEARKERAHFVMHLDDVAARVFEPARKARG